MHDENLKLVHTRSTQGKIRRVSIRKFYSHLLVNFGNLHRAVRWCEVEILINWCIPLCYTYEKFKEQQIITEFGRSDTSLLSMSLMHVPVIISFEIQCQLFWDTIGHEVIIMLFTPRATQILMLNYILTKFKLILLPLIYLFYFFASLQVMYLLLSLT